MSPPKMTQRMKIALVVLIHLGMASYVRGQRSANKRFRPAVGACTLQSKTYISSTLEQQWLQNAGAWAKEYCARVPVFEEDTRKWLNSIRTVDERHASNSFNESVFSRFVEKYNCNGRIETVTTWIEPLSHGLRHPNALCERGAMLTDRDYLLLPFKKETLHPHRRCSGRLCQSIFIDLGASTWTQGSGGPSQSWFHDAYKKHGILFDRMLLWEARPTPPTDIFKDLPKHVWHSYQYFNMPASADESDPSSPLNILKTIAQVDDFVVLKLDIDTPHVESRIVTSILNDKVLQSLIDEFYYEYHVDFQPMNLIWYSNVKAPTADTLQDAYALFYRFREIGIRAHSWI